MKFAAFIGLAFTSCLLLMGSPARADGGFLGITAQDQRLGASVARSVVVSAVAPNSPAMRAGLAPGDIVAGVDYDRVHSVAELQKYVFAKNPNETIAVVVIHDDGKVRAIHKLTVVLANISTKTEAHSSPALGDTTKEDFF